jgi:hypothetical protein
MSMGQYFFGHFLKPGQVQQPSRTGPSIRAITLGLVLFGLLSCTEAGDDGDCFYNVDCGGKTACVQGVCVAKFTECKMLGAFQPVVTQSFNGVNRLEEGHIVIDDYSAVHYCYTGFSNNGNILNYGRQTSSSSFTEIPISHVSYPQLHCSALAIALDGTPFILDKQNALILYRFGGVWRVFTLREIETSLERADLSGNDTVIHMTPDSTGGVYVGISMGYTHTEQKLYLAHVTTAGFELLKNGLRNSDILSGHAPQFAPQTSATSNAAQSVLSTPYYVSDDLKRSVVSLNDPQIGPIQSVEGGYPRVDLDEAGYLNILYVDTNYFLRVARMQNGLLQDKGTVGQIDFDSPDAQIPWVFDVRPTGTAHVLFEDNTQGYNTLSYRKVSQTDVSELQIITTTLSSELKGSQKYAISTDICRRATVAVFEEEISENQETGTMQSRTVLTVKEQR